MIELFKLNDSLDFPALDFALDEPNGLLAYGGDLSPERLIEAYKRGIFPWYSEQEPILWWSPDPRAVINAEAFKANKSLRKSIRKFGYSAKLNHNFNEVINYCAKVPRKDLQHLDETAVSTWITNEMRAAYIELHAQGFAHSVEIYDKHSQLVGGLYGVVVSGVFCGESMFHLQSDASKAAFLALTKHMVKNGMKIIDCQLVNPHLQSLGCEAVGRNQFMRLLSQHSQWFDCWQPQSLVLLE